MIIIRLFDQFCYIVHEIDEMKYWDIHLLYCFESTLLRIQSDLSSEDEFTCIFLKCSAYVKS